MALKRLENSIERLHDKMNEGRKYLEKEDYVIHELIRLRNNLEKKKLQFEKDIAEYEKMDEKDGDKVADYEAVNAEAEDVYDDLEHYINVKKQEEQELERRHQREAEEKRLELEERERERRYQLEMEKMKIEEKITIQQLHVEEVKVEAEKKIATVKENSKMTVKLPKIELKKFNGDILKWTEFWDAFESTIHNNHSLHDVDKFNYLRSQLQGAASEVLSGLELTNKNYKTAVELLKERFGRKQFMIDAHYAKMTNMPISTYRAASLRAFYDTTEKHLRCLQTLGEDDNQMYILSLLKSKLPRSVLVELEKLKPEDEEWTLQKFRKSLNRHINNQEAGDVQMKLHHSRDENQRSSDLGKSQNSFAGNNNYTGEMLLSSERTKNKFGRKCIFCKEDHWSDECQKFANIQSRRRQIKNRCLKCMRDDHRVKDCRVTGKICVHCGEKDKHHRTLCPKKFLPNEDQKEKDEMNGQESELVAIGENVVMQTALVTMKNDNKTIKSRALFDTGSTRTYITEDLVNSLKLKPIEEHTFSIYAFGNTKPKQKTSPVVELLIKTKCGSDIKIKATVTKHITGPLQRLPLKLANKINVKNEFELADTLPTKVETYTLGLLIGNDHYYDFILDTRTEIQNNLYLVKSKLGWIVSGRTTTKDNQSNESLMFAITSKSQLPRDIHFMNVDDLTSTFEPNVEDLWKLETIGIKPNDPHEQDDIALQMFKSTVTKEDQRYSVSWPWRNADQDLLPENYELSLGRLKSLIKRLERDPDLLQRYDEIIKTQAEKGIVEKVETSEVNNTNKKHYIPHHVVIKPDNATTKLRIVYDASAKTKKGNKSLNECLHRGPVILEDLCGLLLRFRTKKIGVIADLEKAFLQIGIHESDRDVTRFLWLKDVSKPVTKENLEVYRFARVPFGIISSPFLLGATVQHHLEETESPIGDKIKNKMYVDNIITGCDNEDEAVELYHQGKAIFQDASMNLREWLTSSEKVNNKINPEDQVEAKVTKVLGMTWNSQSDELSISTKKIETTKPATTKREVLATIASIYDPLGMMNPVIIDMKTFLQDLWEKNIDWDDSMDEIDRQNWLALTRNLNEISRIQIPRYIGDKQTRLLGFCDASKKAYATAIYLRTVIDGEVNVNLIFSKARVAPKEKKTADKGKTKKTKERKLTIPRLELMSTLIATRSLRFIAKELGLEDTGITLWTDSQCVLNWLKQKQNDDIFVRNRVSEIIKGNDITFRYVDTNDNPADIPTRGTTVTELKSKTLWWNGPEWLKKDPEDWPSWDYEAYCPSDQDQNGDNNIIYEMSGAQPEVKQNLSPFEIEETKYSSFTKLLRVTAYANRFIRHMKNKRRANQQAPLDLTAEEMDEAEKQWIKYIQREHYLTPTGMLNQKQKQNQLNPSTYEDGIVRLKGRFGNSDLPQETKTPILLPREEHFTKLLIAKIHNDICHGGVAHTLAQLRQRYWIPQGRTGIKAVLKKCLTCIRHQGGPYKVKPIAPLPKSRVTTSAPFTNTGIDYFGPLYIKEKANEKKAWVCLFTCTAVRAVHLEVVEDMTTEHFLEALRRFIARRGKPDEIISDNANQFKAAKNTIDLAWENILVDPQVQSYLSEKRIKWKFIVELSPWMGGFYERLVGTTKSALKKSIGRLHLSLTQLQTIITEIESVVNSRPLVYVDNETDNEIITPMHFLSINPKNGTPILEKNENDDDPNDPDYQNEEMSTAKKLLETWKKGNRHLEQFWKIWKDSYLLNLRERNQKANKHPRIQSQSEAKVGDIVQVKEAAPRGTWKIGRIIELINSQDGEKRAARIVMPNKNILQRSIVHLYPLECHDEHVTSTDEDTDEQMNPMNGGAALNQQPHVSKQHTQRAYVRREDTVNVARQRSRRKAAQEARDKIVGQTLADV